MEFTKDECQCMDPAQRTLSKDVMMKNHHLVSVGCCVTTPQVIFKLEQSDEPWTLEEEFLNQRCPGYYKVSVHIAGKWEETLEASVLRVL